MADLTYADAIIDAEAAAFEAVRNAHRWGKISSQVRNYLIDEIGEMIHVARRDSPDGEDVSDPAQGDLLAQQPPKQEGGDPVS